MCSDVHTTLITPFSEGGLNACEQSVKGDIRFLYATKSTSP